MLRSLNIRFWFFFFFFKQKTAYEIRPCDWSSDVCSSDLCTAGTRWKSPRGWPSSCTTAGASRHDSRSRSEERRVGKECTVLGRSRWSSDQKKKKKKVTIMVPLVRELWSKRDIEWSI